ncbi:MAG: KpsF/GutQ family sugar-phosphate isomerase [Lentisphaeraceae bacterium]|nr:KpsF/GutQ family sugar-phosphate isomerase [Lentisphaeraceae bacterium]
MNIIEKARQVLKIESDGINTIANQLDERFEELVKLCFETISKNGKIVLCGIGKSGQISQKLASTLSSTGSRSMFVHPVEALHGDLGMIHKDDICLALSYSGETDELLNVLPSIRRLGNKIVGITGDEKSALARLSDLVVPCTIEQEACPFNLAPTTTTTAMLALGDALAMVLMEMTEFKINDYGHLHPSGAIGRSVTLKVSDIMRKEDRLAVVTPDIKVKDAVLAMCQAKGGTVLVGDKDSKLLGIFTTGDLKRGLSVDQEILTKPVHEVMVKQPTTVNVNQMAVSIIEILRKKNINAIPVVDDTEVIVGLIDIQDLPKFKVL